MTTQQRSEGPQHHLSSLSLIGAKKKRITLLPQVRSHVLEHDRVYLFVSQVNILYQPVPIHFGESVFTFGQPGSERE